MAALGSLSGQRGRSYLPTLRFWSVVVEERWTASAGTCCCSSPGSSHSTGSHSSSASVVHAIVSYLTALEEGQLPRKGNPMRKLIIAAVCFGALCAVLQADDYRPNSIKCNSDPNCVCPTGGVCTCGTNCNCGDYFPLAMDLAIGTRHSIAPPQAASAVNYGCQGGQGGHVTTRVYTTTTTYASGGCSGASAGGCTGYAVGSRRQHRIDARHAKRSW